MLRIIVFVKYAIDELFFREVKIILLTYIKMFLHYYSFKKTNNKRFQDSWHNLDDGHEHRLMIDTNERKKHIYYSAEHFVNFCFDFSAVLESIYWNELITVSRDIFVEVSKLGTIVNISKIMRVVNKKINKVSVSFVISIYRLHITSAPIIFELNIDI